MICVCGGGGAIQPLLKEEVCRFVGSEVLSGEGV